MLGCSIRLQYHRPPLVLLGLLSVSLGASDCKRHPHGLSLEAPARIPVSEGVEVLEANLSGKSEELTLTVLYASLESIETEIILNPAEESLERLSQGQLLVMNAGFFTPKRRSTGLLISQGERLAPFVRQGGAAGSGVFVWGADGLKLLVREDLNLEEVKSATLAIQAGPRIIEPDGQAGIRADDGEYANRSFIGVDGYGRLAIGVFRSKTPGIGRGVTLYEVQNVLGSKGLGRIHPKLGMRAALNLDGGPSTGLFLRAGNVQRTLPEGHPVQSVLRVRLKSPAREH
jgi:hypothetical protein